MNTDTRSDIANEARRVFAEDAAAHRQYLERQFNQLRWSVTVLLAIILAAVYFFTGRSLDDLDSYARAQVDERVVDYLVKDAVREQLEREIRVEIEQRVAAPETQASISATLETAISDTVTKRASQEINIAVEREIERLKTLDVLPRGTIVAWFSDSGSIPAGWALCDGTQGTPDLRDRYVIGAASLALVGERLGAATHSHNFAAQTSDARRVPDGWRVESRGAPAATGLDHRHQVQGTSDSTSNLPPSVYLSYIMKL